MLDKRKLNMPSSVNKDIIIIIIKLLQAFGQGLWIPNPIPDSVLSPTPFKVKTPIPDPDSSQPCFPFQTNPWYRTPLQITGFNQVT